MRMRDTGMTAVYELGIDGDKIRKMICNKYTHHFKRSESVVEKSRRSAAM